MKMQSKILSFLTATSLSVAGVHAAALSYSNDFDSGAIGGTVVGDGLWGGAGVDDDATQPGGADGDQWAYFQTGTDSGGPANASAGVVFDLGQAALLADGGTLNYSFELGLKTTAPYGQANGFTLEFYDGDPTGAGTQVGSTFTHTPNYDEAYGGGAGSEVDSVSGSLALAGNTSNNLFARFYFDGTANNTAFEQGLLNNVSITQVPEPSSAALLGLGGLALILRRRK